MRAIGSPRIPEDTQRGRDCRADRLVPAGRRLLNCGQVRPENTLSAVVCPFLLILTFVLVAVVGHAADSRPRRGKFKEYQVKAAFLLNFTRYVDWPTRCFSQTNSPIVISVLGQDRFGDDLRTLITDSSVEGRKLVLRKVTSAEDAKDSQVLFVSQSEKGLLPEIIQTLKNRPILTVGETENFISAGGIINFKIEGETVSLEINRAAAERAGLKISSKLLQIANRAKGRD